MLTVAVVLEAKTFSCVLVLVFPIVWVSQRFLKWGLRLTLTLTLTPSVKHVVWEVMLNSICGWEGEEGCCLQTVDLTVICLGEECLMLYIWYFFRGAAAPHCSEKNLPVAYLGGNYSSANMLGAKGEEGGWVSSLPPEMFSFALPKDSTFRLVGIK